MGEYTVTWTIRLTADSPEKAAKIALAIQHDKETLAKWFDVTDTQGNRYGIYLSE